ncbi:hypothetical protein ACFU7D_26945 [Nocardioides sp. NPDC057577]|uniref:hypothetical protein n=1 Tax=Nocardioides sp. NPDC057577 TaxID=3346171 RepID=UPI00366DEC88
MPLSRIEESTTRHEGGVEFGGGRVAYAPGEATVADAMVRRPKLLPATATGRDVRDLFGDDHVHAALVVDDRTLLTVIEPHEAEVSGDAPARTMGTLEGRTVVPGADLWETWTWMTRNGCRRLAVVEDGRCVGLLCLKRSSRGFCCDLGIRARAIDGHGEGRVLPTPHHRS